MNEYLTDELVVVIEELMQKHDADMATLKISLLDAVDTVKARLSLEEWSKEEHKLPWLE